MAHTLKFAATAALPTQLYSEMQQARIGLISCGISAAGDLLLQSREGVQSASDFDGRRTGRIAAYRAVQAPVVDTCAPP